MSCSNRSCGRTVANSPAIRRVRYLDRTLAFTVKFRSQVLDVLVSDALAELDGLWMDDKRGRRLVLTVSLLRRPVLVERV